MPNTCNKAVRDTMLVQVVTGNTNPVAKRNSTARSELYAPTYTSNIAKNVGAVELNGLGVGPQLVGGGLGEVASASTVSNGSDEAAT
jgi:hypothetical protein